MFAIREYLNNIGGMLLVATLSFSCSTSKDIYQNPYQVDGSVARQSAYAQTVAVETSTQQQPDWIYAVSRDFYVGYGQGSSVMEAKYAALNDIKAFIVKSLGETGNVKEVTIVKNTITGHNKASSREDYLLQYDFENEYQPVVHISFNGLEDYYYESTGYTARYYIKYNINEAELQRIQEEFQKSLKLEEARINMLEEEQQKSLQKEKARKIEIKHSIDSLTSFQGLLSIESLLDRYHVITDFIYEQNLDNTDSLILIRGLRNLKGFLSAVEVEVLENKRGEFLRFGLFSGNTLLTTEYQPIVYLAGVQSEDLTVEDGIWEYKYSFDEGPTPVEEIKIAFELPYNRIETSVDINPEISQPEFRIEDKVLFSNVELNHWSGRLKALKVGFNIHSNSNIVCQLSNLDLVLHVDGAVNPVIHINPINQEIPPGLSRVVREVDCQLPSRFFMRNDTTCDLKLYLSQNGSTSTYELYDVPITINR